MIDLQELGAHVVADAPLRVRFGVHLPTISWTASYRVKVLVIHERDQFVREVPPREFYLDWQGGAYDLWSAEVELAGGPGHLGEAGTHLYRYQLLHETVAGEEVVVRFFADPFGRAAGKGTLSAFTTPADQDHAWADDGFTVPEVDDLVIYELHVGEFGGGFAAVADGIPYLTSLGVNALELMPVTNVKEDVEWGYTPLGYFAPDDRYGGGAAFRGLVETCHRAGVAVVLDAVYAHSHPEFAYNIVYRQAGLPNPVMGPFGQEFGKLPPGWNYHEQFTRDYFDAVSRYWLTEFHVDGFRYDYVPGFWDGVTGDGYSGLVQRTYRLSQDFDQFPRFFAGDGNRSRIIQCAEFLDAPVLALTSTYSNTVWQDQLLHAARNQAEGTGATDDYARRLDPELGPEQKYPSRFVNQGDSFPVAPLQYIESHDHQRFVTRLGVEPTVDQLEMALGDRSLWARTQPYAIAQYTAKGVPMLWQGQEFAENWNLPGGTDPRRITFSRPLHWEYFYDDAGRALIRLYRVLGRLRRTHRVFSSRGDFYLEPSADHRRDGIVVFRRISAGEAAVVVLNFSNEPRTVRVWWPTAGRWIEQLDRAEAHPQPDVVVGENWESHDVTVPSNYGGVYMHEPDNPGRRQSPALGVRPAIGLVGGDLAWRQVRNAVSMLVRARSGRP